MGQTPAPLYCSDDCCLDDLYFCHGTIDVQHNPNQCPSPHFTAIPQSFTIKPHGLQDNSNLCNMSFKPCFSTSSSPTTSTMAKTALQTRNHAVNAYLHLSTSYGFAPLSPPHSFTPKTSVLTTKPAFYCEDGIILATCHIQTALCTTTITLS